MQTQFKTGPLTEMVMMQKKIRGEKAYTQQKWIK